MSALLKDEDDLDKAIRENDRVMILFYASWCPFSRKFLPMFEEQADTASDPCRRLVIDDLDEVTEKYAINVFPTVLLFEKGKVAKRLDGKAGIGLNGTELAGFIGSCGFSR
ncbi:MAG TPA: thioredoxin family protein [Candidatus Omnitrophota bacterium]|nr:thioredoxin family protein [Candidatus Omnitrophota bacterium]